MIRGDRVQERIDAIHSSQAALARAVKLSPQAVSKIVNGETRDSGKLYQIARFLGTTPEYLTGESDVPEASSPTDRQLPYSAAEVDPDEVEIDSLDLSYGMGGGTFVDFPEGDVTKAKFSREWLRKFTHSAPELLFTTSGVGDSMAPTINDSDLVIVDRSVRLEDALGDKIWAIVFGGVGYIKRLRPMPDGTVKIMSDNQSVRDEIATDNDLFVVGRVVASVRRH